jgi:hypothetical protein
MNSTIQNSESNLHNLENYDDWFNLHTPVQIGFSLERFTDMLRSESRVRYPDSAFGTQQPHFLTQSAIYSAAYLDLIPTDMRFRYIELFIHHVLISHSRDPITP